MSGKPEHKKNIVPETHENIRNEDIEECIRHLSDSSNSKMPNFAEEHFAWIRMALAERRQLCAKQFETDGTCNTQVTNRLHELDSQIDSISPYVLRILHYLSRIRAIVPTLLSLQERANATDTSPQQKMVDQMKYECSRAEVHSAIEGLAELRIRPNVLDELAKGET